MTFSITNTFVDGDVLTAAQLNENFTDVANSLNAGITTDNLSSTAGILATQLSENNAYFTVTFEIGTTEWASLSTPSALAGLPGLNDTYIVVSGSYVCADCGTVGSEPQMVVQWGEFTGASNAWVTTTTVVNTVTLNGNSAGPDLPTHDALTIATGAIAQSATVQRFLRIYISARGTNTLTDAGSRLTVTLLLKHVLVA